MGIVTGMIYSVNKNKYEGFVVMVIQNKGLTSKCKILENNKKVEIDNNDLILWEPKSI